MNLTTDQQRAVREGDAVAVTIDDTECVLLRRDIFDRVRRVVEYDDSAWSDAEKRAILRSFGEKAGWDDPELDVYEQYRTA
jgi:hypothetical protein